MKLSIPYFYIFDFCKALREHQQKNFVMLSRFWPLRGRGGVVVVWVNPLKKKICDKNLSLSDNAEWSSKNLRKMISADIKANK